MSVKYLRGHAWIRENHTWPRFFRETLSAQIHSIGSLAALLGMIPLVAHASRTGHVRDVIAVLIFGISGVLVFSVSTLFHFMHDGFAISKQLEDQFENLDHVSIYIFIAGTYTPFLINTVAEPWCTRLLIAVWLIVLFGVSYTLLRSRLPAWMQSRALYTGLFVSMGWVALVRLPEVLHNLTSQQLLFLFGGATAYTTGAVVYATKRPSLFPSVFGFHELWHLFVLVGFAFHYALIYSFY